MSVKVPKYRLHKASGQALVQINGLRTYLGKHESEASKEKYRRLVAEFMSTGACATSGGLADNDGVTINELILRYWRFALGYYRKNGELTGETDNIRAALKHVRGLYGSTPATDFDANALELVREAMIDAGLARTTINSRVGKIKRMFRWAATKRCAPKKTLVPAETYYSLKAVADLQIGRFNVRETSPVRPVPSEYITAILPNVNPVVRAMIRVQEFAGMRPQDVRNMRTCDIDRTGDVWVYQPWTHKTEHRGHVRRIAVGPKAQEILRPFLKTDDPTAYVFSPKEAVAVLRAERRRARKTPMTPSQRARKPKSEPKRAPGEQYTKSSYENAIVRACKKTGVPRWGPNRLRHNCATKVRRKYGIEVAAAVLGNSLGMVAEVYADTVFEKAIKAMREMG